jgi:hypothetical protein
MLDGNYLFGFDWFEEPFAALTLNAVEGFDSQLWDPAFEAIP